MFSQSEEPNCYVLFRSTLPCEGLRYKPKAGSCHVLMIVFYGAYIINTIAISKDISLQIVTHRVSAFRIQSYIKCLECVRLGAYRMARLCNFAEKVCTLVHTVFADVHVLLWCTHWSSLAVRVKVQHPAVAHYKIQWHHLIQWHSHNFIREELPWWLMVGFMGS